MDGPLDAHLEHILTLQPSYLYLRMLVPLLMIQLGKDDEAYNFIKFWIKITPVQGKWILQSTLLFYQIEP